MVGFSKCHLYHAVLGFTSCPSLQAQEVTVGVVCVEMGEEVSRAAPGPRGPWVQGLAPQPTSAFPLAAQTLPLEVAAS